MDDIRIRRMLHQYDQFHVDSSNGHAILNFETIVETDGGDLYKATIAGIDLENADMSISTSSEYTDCTYGGFYNTLILDRIETARKSQVSFTMPFGGNILIEQIKSSGSSEFCCNIEEIL